MTAADLAVANALAAARKADTAKAVSTRDPFIPPGRHELILAEIAPEMGEDEHGNMVCRVWVRYVAEETTQPEMQCPIMLAQVFDLLKRPQYPSQASDTDRFMLLIQVVSGLPNDIHLKEKSKLLKLYEDLIKNRVDDQLLRGRQLGCVGEWTKPEDGVTYFKGNNGHECFNRKGKTYDRWVNTAYTHKGTSAEDVLELRKFLDENFPIRKREKRQKETRSEDQDDDRGSAPPRQSPAPKRSSVLDRLKSKQAALPAASDDDIPF